LRKTENATSGQSHSVGEGTSAVGNSIGVGTIKGERKPQNVIKAERSIVREGEKNFGPGCSPGGWRPEEWGKKKAGKGVAGPRLLLGGEIPCSLRAKERILAVRGRERLQKGDVKRSLTEGAWTVLGTQTLKKRRKFSVSPRQSKRRSNSIQ